METTTTTTRTTWQANLIPSSERAADYTGTWHPDDAPEVGVDILLYWDDIRTGCVDGVISGVCRLERLDPDGQPIIFSYRTSKTETLPWSEDINWMHD